MDKQQSCQTCTRVSQVFIGFLSTMSNPLMTQLKHDGFIIVRNVISSSKIDNVCRGLKEAKSRKKLIYSQSRHKWQPIELDNFGLMVESILNPSTLGNLGLLRSSIIDIIHGDEVNNLMKQMNEKSASPICWQDMLFDKSTGTVDHIDSWYLDTFDRGQLVGLWIALEDITIDGGSFHVYQSSHNQDWSSVYNMKHPNFIEYISRYCSEAQESKRELLVSKGDVIVWSSLLVHGSGTQIKPFKSRLSITAHYFFGPQPLITNKKCFSLKDVLKRIRSVKGQPIQRFYPSLLTTFSYRYLIGALCYYFRIDLGPRWNMRRK